MKSRPVLTTPDNNSVTRPVLRKITNPFPIDANELQVLEPLEVAAASIYKRLLDGTYGRPFIVDNKRYRSLYLGLTYVQSVMSLNEPDVLSLRYTEMMANFLLFNPTPRHIALLGLGGGSLAKFCFHSLPDATVDVIEIDPDVISLREYFHIPDDQERFRVIQGDAADYVAKSDESIDVLLADAFDADGLASSLSAQTFLLTAYNSLKKSGILVMNLAGEETRYTDLIEQAVDMFDGQIIVVPVHDDENQILFAFKQKAFEPNWTKLTRRARELKSRFNIDFPQFVQHMERQT